MVTQALAADRPLAGVAAVLFVVAATATAVWCSSMSAMGMPMSGGWMMSRAWMRMPGQTWPGAAATFLGMWVVMMVAMMLPPLVPMLARYRQAVAVAAGPGLGWLTAMAAGGYFTVWTLAGVVVYPVGMALAAIEMAHDGLSRAVPAACAIVVLLSGIVQWTDCKTRSLACWAAAVPADARAVTPKGAWRQGLSFGVACGRCCVNLMLIAVVMGVMDVTVMAVVTVAIAAERLLPAGVALARATGVALIGGGTLLLAVALGAR